MRYISIDLSADSHLQQPHIFGGYAGEHNESILQVKLPARMIDIESSGYRFDFQTAEGDKISSPLIPATELDDDVLSFSLTDQLTIAGKLLFNVVVTLSGQDVVSFTAKTNMVVLYIGDSPDGNAVLPNPDGYKDEILAMIDDRITAITVDLHYDSSSEKAQSGIAVTEAVADKVDKEVGKGLSTNDYTTAEKNKLSGIESGAQVNVAPDQQYSSVSTNAQSGTAVAEAISSKVDKVNGKGLSENDYTTAEKTKLQGIETGAQVNVAPDLHYNANSNNAQSGKAVAEAIAGSGGGGGGGADKADKADVDELRQAMIDNQLFANNALKNCTWMLGYTNPSTGQTVENRGYMSNTIDTLVSVLPGDEIELSGMPTSNLRGFALLGWTNENVFVDYVNIASDNTAKIPANSTIRKLQLRLQFIVDVASLPDDKPVMYINSNTINLPVELGTLQANINTANQNITNTTNTVNSLSDSLDAVIANNESLLYEKDVSYFLYHITTSNNVLDLRGVYRSSPGITSVDFGDGTVITDFTNYDVDLYHSYPQIDSDYTIAIKGLTVLGNSAFNSHTRLYKAILSKNITSVGASAFADNDANMVGYMQGSEPPTVRASSFSSWTKLYVHDEDYLQYYSAWSGIFANLNFLFPMGETSTLYRDKTVTVGTNGDFSTLNDAIAHLSQYYPAYRKGGVTCNILILSGTTISEQIYVVRQDLQFITITAEDNYVPVDASSFGVTADAHDSRGNYPFFAGENAAKLPTIGCLFRLTVQPDNEGYGASGLLANRGSEAVVLANSGFEYFYDGVISNNESTVTIREGISRNMTRWGVHARHNGEISARSADLSNCGISAYADRVADLDVRGATFDGSTQCLVCYHASRITSNFGGAGSAIDCGDGTGYLVDAQYGGLIDSSNVAFTGANSDVFLVAYGGTIIASGATATGIAEGKSLYSKAVNIIDANGIIIKDDGTSPSFSPADRALLGHWYLEYANPNETPTQNNEVVNKKYVDDAVAGAGLLPVVTAADNGKFLRVVNGVWAAQSVPSAESEEY